MNSAFSIFSVVKQCKCLDEESCGIIPQNRKAKEIYLWLKRNQTFAWDFRYYGWQLFTVLKYVIWFWRIGMSCSHNLLVGRCKVICHWTSLGHGQSYSSIHKTDGKQHRLDKLWRCLEYVLPGFSIILFDTGLDIFKVFLILIFHHLWDHKIRLIELKLHLFSKDDSFCCYKS